MKKFLPLALAFALFFAACKVSYIATSNNPENNEGENAEIQEIRRYIEKNPLDTEVSAGYGETFGDFSCIAAMPDKDIYLYTCKGGDGILLKFQDKYEIFDYFALTPRLIFPEMFLYDYDGDGREELAIKLYQASGTGVSMWSLLMVGVNEEAKRYGDIFYRFSHAMLGYDEICEMVSAHIEKIEAYAENGGYFLDIYFDGIKYAIDLTDLKEAYGDDAELSDICLSNINDVDIENAIIVSLPIGYVCSGAAVPFYNEWVMYAEMNYRSGKFQISRTWITAGEN